MAQKLVYSVTEVLEFFSGEKDFPQFPDYSEDVLEQPAADSSSSEIDIPDDNEVFESDSENEMEEV